MSRRDFGHVVGRAFRQSKEMEPVAEGKSPFIGFVLGFLFGPFGVGLYLQSGLDFVITSMFVLAGSIVTGGIAAPVLWCICGAWAAVRIRNSNKRSSNLYRPSLEARNGSAASMPDSAGQAGPVSDIPDPRFDRQRRFPMPL